MTAWAVMAGVVIAVAVALLVRAARPVPGTVVGRWARTFGLELDAAERRLVGAYLSRARRWWTIGAVAPLLIAIGVAFWSAGVRQRPAPPAFERLWLLIPIGYLAGAVLAEATWRRPRPEAVRAAALVPRRLAHYLPARIPTAIRAAALAALALAVPIAVLPFHTEYGFGGETVPALVEGALAVMVGAGVEGLMRWIISRPQPAVSPRAVALDGALRSSSVRTVAGAGLGVLLLILSSQLFRLGGTDVPGLTVIVLVLGFGYGVLAYATWWELGRVDGRPNRPPRPADRPPEAVEPRR